MRAHAYNMGFIMVIEKEGVLDQFRSATKKWMKLVDMALQPHGLIHSDARILVQLYSMDGCPLSELASEMDIDRSNVGRSIGRLEKGGYISRLKDDSDGRAYRVFLSDKGKRFRKTLDDMRKDLGQVFNEGLSSSEIEGLVAVMKKIDSNLSRALSS